MYRRLSGSAAIAGGALLAMTGLSNRPGQAQPTPAPPQFEVASIKPSTREIRRPIAELNIFRTGVAHDPRLSRGRFSINNVPLTWLVQVAYNLEDFQVMGGPWANSDGYDIIAKADSNANFAQMRLMLQSLLADRFQLTLRRETREFPVYELTGAKSGIKLAPPKDGCTGFDPDNPPPLPKWQPHPAPLNICDGVRFSSEPPKETVEGRGVSMTRLVEFLSEDLGRIVFDKTGVTKKFDLRIEFYRDEEEMMRSSGPIALASSTDPRGPSIFTALQEQLARISHRLRSTSVENEAARVFHRPLFCSRF